MDSVNPLTLQFAVDRTKIFRYAFILQFITAAPFLWFAYATGKTQATLLFGSKAAPGTIVAVVPVHLLRTASSGAQYSRGVVYDVIVEYVPSDQPVRFLDRRTTPLPATVGSTVRVIFDPTHPLTAMVDRGYLNYLPWGPCTGIGIFLVVVAGKGFVSFLFSRLRSS